MAGTAVHRQRGLAFSAAWLCRLTLWTGYLGLIYWEGIMPWFRSGGGCVVFVNGN